MRVISQDGTVDVPYEDFVFVRSNANKIACEKYGRGSVAFMIAEYSTKEKAQKAMSMLSAEYKRFQTTTDKHNYYFAFDYPKVFKFPADADI